MTARSPSQRKANSHSAALFRRRRSIRARIEGAETMASAYETLAQPNPVWGELAAQAKEDAEAARAELAALDKVCETAVGE